MVVIPLPCFLIVLVWWVLLETEALLLDGGGALLPDSVSHARMSARRGGPFSEQLL